MSNHLIHIGWAKAGSTFLQRWFAEHPDLRFQPGGVGGYRDVWQMADAPETACKYYVTSAEQLVAPSLHTEGVQMEIARGEPSPIFPIQTRQAEICALLKRMFPGSRILLVTRGFRDLARSGLSEAVRNGLAADVRSRFARRKDMPQGAPYRHRDFDYVIRLYREAFGEENVIVLPYELLRDDEPKFLRMLEERLGLQHADLKIGRVNESLTPEELYWYPKISRVVSTAASTLGDRAFRALYRRYLGVTMRNGLRPLIRVLARIHPGGRVTEAAFPPDYALHFAGRADSLRDDPLYAAYGDEYLWTEESRRPVAPRPAHR